jgi:soluble lytic murein transglycosylase
VLWTLTQDPYPRAQKVKALRRVAELAAKADKALAKQALLALWADHPTQPSAGWARGKLGAAAVTAEVRVRRAEGLIALNRSAEALREVRGLRASGTLSCRVELVKAKVLRLERRHSDIIRTLTPVVERCDDESFRPKALFQLAYSQGVVDVAAGARSYETLAAEYPEHPLAAEALYAAAELQVRAGDAPKALALLKALLASNPSGELAAEALFRQFWIHRQRDEHDAALVALGALDQLPPGSLGAEQRQRAWYWKARVVEERDGVEHATGLLELLAVGHPSTYYGLMARGRLLALDKEAARRVERTLRPGASNVASTLDLAPLQNDRHFAAGRELLKLGITQASTELMAVDFDRLEPGTLMAVYGALERQGHRKLARSLVRFSEREEMAGPVSAASLSAWRSTYIEKYRPLVDRYSRSVGVDPDLMRALIREESGFNPNVRSPVGAIGLTQLMLPTATDLARQLRIPAVSPASLLDPSQNVRLGSLYLATLLRRFQEHPAYAIASYNAGPGAVSKWKGAKPNAAIDEWVEEIPLHETRAYVKRVMSSYAMYKLIGTKPMPTLLASAARP